MEAKTYCLLMSQYNRWMNDRIYTACDRLSDGERKEDLRAFFKSIHGTLNHLLWGDRAWLGRFTGKPVVLTPVGEDLYSDFDILKEERRKLDEEIIRWSAQLDEQWLNGTISFESIVYKKTITLPAFAAVVQMFNHQTHHRGQLTTLLSQKGIDYGPTDVPVMPGLSEIFL